jgi:hypothetical protein
MGDRPFVGTHYPQNPEKKIEEFKFFLALHS